MNAKTRIIIYSIFIAATALLLFTAPGRKIVNRISGVPEQNVLPETQQPLFVEFYTDSCSVCQAMEPAVDELKNIYSDRVQFVMIDADDAANYDLAKQFGITGVPEFFWITSGKEVLNSGAGGVASQAMQQAFEELLMYESKHNNAGASAGEPEEEPES